MASSGNESDADSVESVSLRVARLTHMLAGRGAQLQGPVIAVGQDGMMPMMLDALLVLYDECNTEHLMKNQYIASFVRKCKLLFPVWETDYSPCKVKDISPGRFMEVQLSC